MIKDKIINKTEEILMMTIAGLGFTYAVPKSEWGIVALLIVSLVFIGLLSIVYDIH